jgi:ubiquinone/menaquinone biosynthesis C-methylase UbiE
MNPNFSGNPFDDLYKEKGYLSLKWSLFNYRLRKWRIAKHVPPSGLILDVGSGVAPVSPDLGRTVLADISEEAMKSVDLPVREKFVMSVTDLSFKEGTFDCVLCSEVLEHVEDDAKAISELRRVLKAGGTLVVTVPFRKKYWGEDDEYVGHKRRYEPDELEGKLKAAGFTMVKTYKLSGLIERFLTRLSLRYYLKSKQSSRMPIAFYKAVNSMIFVLLLLAESSISWERTTRILVVAR